MLSLVGAQVKPGGLPGLKYIVGKLWYICSQN